MFSKPLAVPDVLKLITQTDCDVFVIEFTDPSVAVPSVIVTAKSLTVKFPIWPTAV